MVLAYTRAKRLSTTVWLARRTHSNFTANADNEWPRSTNCR